MGDWHESLFSSDKGDSLGDGTWGRPAPDDAALPQVAWDKVASEVLPKRKRVRLATPAPGSQKGSGLLDIKAIAAEMGLNQAADEPRVRQATPPPQSEARTARLATEAKASNGSGLIDVAELVRLQEEAQSSQAGSEIAAVEEIPAPASSSLLSMSASSLVDAPVVMNETELEEPVPAGNRSMLMVMLGVLMLAFVGLAIYVLTSA